MRCKACNTMLEKHGDDTYCRRCIIASNDVDMYNNSVYYDNHIKNNLDLKLQVFLSEYEKKEIMSSS